jgi:hypothetical protein
MRHLTPGLISSSPGTAGLPPFIAFSTSYPKLDSVAAAGIETWSRRNSAFGTKRTSNCPQAMSAFGGKSDTFCSYACAAGISAIFPAQRMRWGKQSGKQLGHSVRKARAVDAETMRAPGWVAAGRVADLQARLVWIPPLNPKGRMRSRWRLVLRIRLTIAAEASRGGHALLESRETAICPAAVDIAVNRTPRIILGFGAHSDSDDGDTNPQDE